MTYIVHKISIVWGTNFFVVR